MSLHSTIDGLYKVQLRRGGRWKVKPEAEQLDGRVFRFRFGWQLTSEDSGLYALEAAMVADWRSKEHPYPDDAPAWLAMGDLVAANAGVPTDLVELAKA